MRAFWRFVCRVLVLVLDHNAHAPRTLKRYKWLMRLTPPYSYVLMEMEPLVGHQSSLDDDGGDDEESGL